MFYRRICRKCHGRVVGGAKVCPTCGSKTARRLTLLGMFGWAALWTVLVVGCIATSQYAQSPEGQAARAARVQKEVEAARVEAERHPPQVTTGCDRHDVVAFAMSQDFVRDELKSPGSASFPSITGPGVKTIYIGNCTHEVRAYVDAQNSFGAQLRTPYVATLQEDVVTGRWRLLALTMNQR